MGCTRLAGFQHDLVGNDEGGIEADTELADQLAVPGLVAGQCFKELLGAGAGDGADVVAHFIAGHADAVIGQGDGAGGLVEFDANLQVRIALI